MSEPRILAIETSGRHGSVAVARGPELLAQRELPATMRHAVELMPAVRDLTQAQGWKANQIDHLYLSLGPGSFTGLRIAVAIARALHQATGCKLIGVPSLDVIAENAPPEFQIVLPILDAKRAQVFAARYERDPAGTLHRTAAPALVDPAAFLQEAIDLADELQSKIENQKSKTQIALLGEGIEYHRAALFSTPHENVTELPKPLWHGTAATLHRLGWQHAQQNNFANPATLIPIYIRLPEAEEVFRKKHGIPF
jgi:tRNA threonylcarbamoyladenosine biosynthesis protein TsaB